MEAHLTRVHSSSQLLAASSAQRLPRPISAPSGVHSGCGAVCAGNRCGCSHRFFPLHWLSLRQRSNRSVRVTARSFAFDHSEGGLCLDRGDIG
jgi:hypothetical protein